MTNTLLNKDYEHAYERKKKDSEERGIGFELSLQEYTAIMKARDVFTCGYTQRKMVMHRGFDHKDYPQMDRIDENKSYNHHNIIFCGAHVHKLKTEYVELGKSRKGLSHEDLCMIRSIEKVLNQPDVLEKRLQPYQEIFDKVHQREQEKEDKEMAHKANLEACEKAKCINEAKAKADEQLALSKHYTMIMTMFEKMGLVYNLSIKQHRDVYRVTRCKISKQPFESMEDKFMWIPNKTTVMEKGMVDKDDFIVTHNNMRDVLDNLTNCGNLKIISLNVLKYI